MKAKEHQLSAIWNSFPEALKSEVKPTLKKPSINKLISELFTVGKFYYYLINIADNSVCNLHENILEMHGLKEYPKYLKEIIDLIHPEDIEFVMAAEKMALNKMQEIGFEHQMNLKNSYSFRMKTADGSYQLFHHQALHFSKDKKGNLLQAINIHTNINHLTTVNNRMVLVSGIGNRTDFYQMSVEMPSQKTALLKDPLTCREKEILNLVAKGFSSAQISELLMLSPHTIRTHRRNILDKTNTKNSSELIKRCLDSGYI